ncbi:MAG: hypothetical protein D6814_11160 [Calditrichaeota bacterium]|nr:MAG: hypothetical protein D6814_11160 [Calditrichota bacterium]
MQRFKTLNLDFIEISPPSSPILREKLNHLLDESVSWSAAIASVDRKTGRYQIILQGTLPERREVHQHAA